MNNKRTMETQLTPPGNKVRVMETTAAMQELVQKLGQQLPENELVKQLQGAMNEHLAQLTSLLSNFESPEEKERKRSIVIIGLDEKTPSEVPKASDRVRADTTAVTEILDLLDVSAAPTSIYRMGHPDPNRFKDRPRKGPRVLKVIMPSSAIQRQVLAAIKLHRNQLKTNQKFQRCLIRPSLTPEQRAMDLAAHQELKRRKESGEKRLYIKNFKVYSNDELSGDY